MNKPAQWRRFMTVIRNRVQTKAAENSFFFFGECITLRFAPGFDLFRRRCVKKMPWKAQFHASRQIRFPYSKKEAEV